MVRSDYNPQRDWGENVEPQSCRKSIRWARQGSGREVGGGGLLRWFLQCQDPCCYWTGLPACGILAPPPGIEPATLAVSVTVLTPGPSKPHRRHLKPVQCGSWVPTFWWALWFCPGSSADEPALPRRRSASPPWALPPAPVRAGSAPPAAPAAPPPGQAGGARRPLPLYSCSLLTSNSEPLSRKTKIPQTKKNRCAAAKQTGEKSRLDSSLHLTCGLRPHESRLHPHQAEHPSHTRKAGQARLPSPRRSPSHHLSLWAFRTVSLLGLPSCVEKDSCLHF